jgi:hypothetical protein
MVEILDFFPNTAFKTRFLSFLRFFSTIELFREIRIRQYIRCSIWHKQYLFWHKSIDQYFLKTRESAANFIYMIRSKNLFWYRAWGWSMKVNIVVRKIVRGPFFMGYLLQKNPFEPQKNRFVPKKDHFKS